MALLTFNNPVIGGDEDAWGAKLNANFDAIASFVGPLDSTELAALNGVTVNIQSNLNDLQNQINNRQVLDPQLTALAGLPGGANKLPYFTGATTASQLDFLDQDDMVSNSALGVPSQQSVKAYVDNGGGFSQLISGIGSTGYVVLPNGLIFQWGRTAPITGAETVTFPIPFPNNPIGATVTPNHNATYVGTVSCYAGDFTQTQMTVVHDATDTASLNRVMWLVWGS